MTHHRSGHWSNAPTQNPWLNALIGIACAVWLVLMLSWAGVFK